MDAHLHACPECGATLKHDAPEGLCPGCLLKAGIETDAAHTPGWTPPSVESLNTLSEDLEVIRLIGQGGMGAVYEARQRKLDRRVALKVLPPELGEQPGFPERLAREARALAKLAHPNVVGIHDFGRAGDLHYVVMEYVDGRSLRQLLADARMEPTRAVEIALQVCDGLHYAHEQGVIHRDIKPENILIDAGGRVRIADFGLAKLVEETKSNVLTGPHDVMGTAHYMAPEQIDRSQPIDQRADLYALGVVFYEMLTGHLPIGRFPPPSQRARSHTHLDEVVFGLLEHDPAKRPATALDVRRAIQQLTPRTPVGAARQMPQTARGLDPARGACTKILIAGCIGFVAMFLPWGSFSLSALRNLGLGGSRSVRAPDVTSELRATFDAWESQLLEIPNGLVGIVAAVLAVLAGISLASDWRAPYRAYGIPGVYGFAHTLGAVVFFLNNGGRPATGSLVTLGAFATILLAAWRLRPGAARRKDPGPSILRRRWRRRRRAAGKPASTPDAQRKQ